MKHLINGYYWYCIAIVNVLNSINYAQEFY